MESINRIVAIEFKYILHAPLTDMSNNPIELFVQVNWVMGQSLSFSLNQIRWQNLDCGDFFFFLNMNENPLLSKIR